MLLLHHSDASIGMIGGSGCGLKGFAPRESSSAGRALSMVSTVAGLGLGLVKGHLRDKRKKEDKSVDDFHSCGRCRDMSDVRDIKEGDNLDVDIGNVGLFRFRVKSLLRCGKETGAIILFAKLYILLDYPHR